ncbi:hypothetical protein [Streptomyces sp. NBC_01353]|uniref:hypothetical protein n=1 Tax=Streptomyces sp. NBC_01353 TaxID=2903835 RepID=UPI002E35F26F|nr:hypothetical protein [Streptomyces sp. NBC_01353]
MSTDQAQQLINAVNDALQPVTNYRDDTPLPVVGPTPPVSQPGRPPMSQKATDLSALMLSGGAASLFVGGSASLVMLASGYADPVVCAILLGSPAVLVLAISRLLGRAKDVMPAEQHHHYNGPVHQHNQTIHTQNRLLGKTTNNL